MEYTVHGVAKSQTSKQLTLYMGNSKDSRLDPTPDEMVICPLLRRVAKETHLHTGGPSSSSGILGTCVQLEGPGSLGLSQLEPAQPGPAWPQNSSQPLLEGGSKTVYPKAMEPS